MVMSLSKLEDLLASKGFVPNNFNANKSSFAKKNSLPVSNLQYILNIFIISFSSRVISSLLIKVNISA